MLSALQLTLSIDCPHRFSKVSPSLNFYMVLLLIMRIFILSVVVYIRVYVIICQINFPLEVFLAFLWATIKGSVVLTLLHLEYISLDMLNLMKITFPLQIPLRLNLCLPFNFPIFWNQPLPIQTCLLLPQRHIPRILHSLDLTRVFFVLIS